MRFGSHRVGVNPVLVAHRLVVDIIIVQAFLPVPTSVFAAVEPLAKHPASIVDADRIGLRASMRRVSFYKILFHFKVYCGSQSSVCPPSPIAKPTLLQCYCPTIGQYTPSYRPPFVCRTPYNIGDGNIL